MYKRTETIIGSKSNEIKSTSRLTENQIFINMKYFLLCFILFCIFFWISSGNLFAQDWEFVQKYMHPQSGNKNGNWFSIATDGNTFLIGNPNKEVVYVVERDKDGQWQQTQIVFSSDLDSIPTGNALENTQYNDFGYSVSVDGNLGLIGCPGNTYDENGKYPSFGAGAAFLIEKDTISGIWKHKQKITTINFNWYRPAYKFLGGSMVLKGKTMVIGAELRNSYLYEPHENISGSVYVYGWNTEQERWTMEQRIENPNEGKTDQFGYRIALLDSMMFLSAHNENPGPTATAGLGAVYVYLKNNDGQWQLFQKIPPPDLLDKADFGYDLAVNENGVLAISAPHYGAGEGIVYLYKLINNKEWEMFQSLVQPGLAYWEYFGNSIAMDEETIAVGVYLDRQDEQDKNEIYAAGSVYLFEEDNKGKWNFFKKVMADQRSSYDKFGGKVLLEKNILAILCEGEDYTADGDNIINDAGAIYLYQKEQDILTGMEPINDKRWQVYPVPVQDRLTIAFDLPLEFETTVEILDASGKSLIKQLIPPNATLVNLDFPYSHGFYLIRVYSGKNYEVFKIIK